MKGVGWTYRGEEAGVGGAGGARSGGGDAVHGGGCDCGFCLVVKVEIGLAGYGGFTYGPVVDGDFTPALPGQLLARGQFDKKVKVMVGHNANEVSGIDIFYSKL